MIYLKLWPDAAALETEKSKTEKKINAGNKWASYNIATTTRNDFQNEQKKSKAIATTETKHSKQNNQTNKNDSENKDPKYEKAHTRNSVHNSKHKSTNLTNKTCNYIYIYI